MGTLQLLVVVQKHEDAVETDDANASEKREIGFRVTTTLIASSDIKKVFETLQNKYKLEQWVTDKYWLQTRDTDTSTNWKDGKEQGTAWERAQFGEEGDKGDWGSSREETFFSDQPGFLGKGKRSSQTALPKTQRLGYYEITFKWKVFDGSNLLKETEEITLKAAPDDSGNINYTPSINKGWIIDV